VSKGPSNPINMTFNPDVVHFDPEAFDRLLSGNGVVLVHWKAIKCPIGIIDRFDARNHSDHDCSNGFIYRVAGEVTAFFSSNSSNTKLDEMGFVTGSTSMVSLPRTYDNSEEEIAVQHFDRFYLKEFKGFSVNSQLIEASITGLDRLTYQATKIEHIVDRNNIWYSANDYVIENGGVRWTGSRRPQYDPATNTGTVYSIRYRYVPFWYVDNIVHEVRVARVYNHAKEQEEVVRLPYAILLQREYIFENEERKMDGTSDPRDVRAPRTGSFGPR